jgi:hypothetical protein
MNVDPIIMERLVAIGAIASSIDIADEFWDMSNPIWHNTNNHAMHTVHSYYWAHEKDDEFKTTFGVILDRMIWLYVTYPEWRARLGWITWLLNLYVADHQVKHETGIALAAEPWNDPRQWVLATQARPMDVVLEKMDNDSAGGLSTEKPTE